MTNNILPDKPDRCESCGRLGKHAVEHKLTLAETVRLYLQGDKWLCCRCGLRESIREANKRLKPTPARI